MNSAAASTAATAEPMTAKFEIPVLIPPELADLARELSVLKDELRSEIEFYRNRGDKKIFSEKEAAEFFGISVKSMREIRNNGLINFTPVKGQFFYTRKNFEDFVERQQSGAKKR